MQPEPKQFIPAALQNLLSYTWPGNARQLENEVKCLVASVRGQSITEEHLDASIRNPDAAMPKPLPQEKPAAGLSSSRSLALAVESL